VAGQIVVSSIKTDSDNSISFLANTGATIFSANLASGLSASSFGNNTITSDKIVSVANTKITGNIISSQITSVANTAIVGLIQSAQIGSANASVIDAGTLTAARLPAGSVLQVVQSTTTTSATTSSTSYVDTGFSASITPTSASSKILIIGSAVIRVGISNTNYQHTIFRNGSVNLAPSASRGFIQCRDAGGNLSDMTPAFAFLDSPATTSATTYNWYHQSEAATNCTFAVDSSFAQITLMEIAA
jgi:hypothetical protein